MADAKQIAEAREILALMSVLSDSSGSSYVATGSANEKGHVILADVDGQVEQTLYEKWKARFNDPANAERFPTMILKAKTEFATRVKRKPGSQGEDRPDQMETTAETEARIIDWYEGEDAVAVAIYETASSKGYCTPSYIRKLRRQNDRHPENGRATVQRDRKVAECRRLRAEGMSIRKIGLELNLAPSTVQRALDAGESEKIAA